jgi:threonine dehydrogenase-like Zn-dependent dehydrogenase
MYCGVLSHCKPFGHFGHEVSGVIEKLGADVGRWRVGDRVFLRSPGKPGGLSEYCLANEVSIGRLPDHMTFIEGAPAQQVPIAVNATRTCRLGDHVAIFGQGSAGLQILQLCRLRGAAKVLVSDWYDERLRISKKLGADVLVNASKEDALKRIAEVFPAKPDVVYDAVGTRSVVRQCVDAVRNEGTVCIFGTHHVEREVAFDLIQWEGKAVNIHMANEGSVQTAREAMRTSERLLEARLIDTKPYITHVFKFVELPKAVELLKPSPILYPEGDSRAKGMPPKKALKVVVKVGPDADKAGG